MMPEATSVGAFAIIPSNDLHAARPFWERMGFARTGGDENYIIMTGWGCELDGLPSSWQTTDQSLGSCSFGKFPAIIHFRRAARTLGSYVAAVSAASATASISSSILNGLRRSCAFFPIARSMASVSA